jgi:hypothetical protein
LRQNGIYLEEKNSISSIQMLGQGNSAYKLTVYTYEIGKSFKGKFTVGKELINYLPVNGHFEVR